MGQESRGRIHSQPGPSRVEEVPVGSSRGPETVITGGRPMASEKEYNGVHLSG